MASGGAGTGGRGSGGARSRTIVERVTTAWAASREMASLFDSLDTTPFPLHLLEWAVGVPLDDKLTAVNEAAASCQALVPRIPAVVLSAKRQTALIWCGDAPDMTPAEREFAALCAPIRSLQAEIVEGCTSIGDTHTPRVADIGSGPSVPAYELHRCLILGKAQIEQHTRACEAALAAAEALGDELVAAADALDITPARAALRLRRLQVEGADRIPAATDEERKYAALFAPLRAWRAAICTEVAMGLPTAVVPLTLTKGSLFVSPSAAAFGVRALTHALAAYPMSLLMVDVCLETLWFMSETAAVKAAIGASHGGVEAIIAVATMHRREPSTVFKACRLLSELASHPPNRAVIVSAGGVDAMVAAVSAQVDNGDVLAEVSLIITDLVMDPDHRAAIGSSVVPALIAGLAASSSNERAVRNACSTLSRAVAFVGKDVANACVHGLPAIVSAQQAHAANVRVASVVLSLVNNVLVKARAPATAKLLAIGAPAALVAALRVHANDAAATEGACRVILQLTGSIPSARLILEAGGAAAAAAAVERHAATTPAGKYARDLKTALHAVARIMPSLA